LALFVGRPAAAKSLNFNGLEKMGWQGLPFVARVRHGN